MDEKKKRAGNVSSPAEVELQELKTRDRKASRNSWTDVYNENTTLQKHKKILGQHVEADHGVEWRVKWAQRVGGFILSIGVILYVLSIRVPAFACGTLAIICYLIICYKNVSLVIVKRLLQELQVVIILVFLILNFWIN